MTDKHITVDSIRWHSVLPWLHLLRAMSLAIRVRPVILATLSVYLVSYGVGFAKFLLGHEAAADPLGAWKVIESGLPQNADGKWPPMISNSIGVSIFVLWPWEIVASSVASLFRLGNSWSSVAMVWTQLLWELFVWAILGGAITRIVSVRIAREEAVSLRSALEFSGRNWQSYIYGPLLPMLAVGLFVALSGCVGTLTRWWGVGTNGVLLYLGWIPVICGLAIACLLLLMALSWPLMVAAISTEGSDGFDGLSRAFGYVMNRPWYFAFLLVLAHFIGVATFWVVSWLKGLTLWLAEWSAGVSQTSDFQMWRGIVDQFVFGVFVSYFWSATTVIYFLLRQSDDGTPLDQVYIPGPPPKPEPLPLVGVAASKQPVIERPATDAATTGDSTVTPDNS